MFCRQALADLARGRHELEAAGTQVAFVHQSSEAEAAAFLRGYGLDDLPRVSDPSRSLYQAFALARADTRTLVSPRLVGSATRAVLAGHRPGRVVGDARQMPGVFLIRDGSVVAAYRHATPADRPDYVGIARCDGEACRLPE